MSIATNGPEREVPGRHPTSMPVKESAPLVLADWEPTDGLSSVGQSLCLFGFVAGIAGSVENAPFGPCAPDCGPYHRN